MIVATLARAWQERQPRSGERGDSSGERGEKKTMDATVAICTFTGARRIGRVLDSLAGQRAAAVDWEVLIVDNASTDATVDVCRRFVPRLPVPLRIVHEPRAGLSYARGCAADHARGRVVCFWDDDTPAEPDCVQAAGRAFRERPNAGWRGGKVKPIW